MTQTLNGVSVWIGKGMIEISKIALLIIGIAMIGGMFYIVKGGQVFGVTGPISIGAIVTSMGQNQYSVAGGDPDMSGSFWTVPISVQSAGNGTPITGTKLSTVDGKTSKDPISISVQVNSQSCNYPIESTYQGLYTYSLKETDCGWLSLSCLDVNWIKQHCIDQYGAGDLTYYGKYSGSSQTAFCIYKHLDGMIGRTTLTQGDLQTNLTLTTNVNGKIEAVNMIDGQTAYTSDNFLRAQWTGYHTQYQCPSSSGVAPLYIGGKWGTYNAATVTDYSSFSTIAASNCDWQRAFPPGPADLKDCIDKYNQKRNAIFPASITSIGGSQAVTTSSADSGVITLYASRLLAYPQLVLKIDADYLVIAESVGKPQLSDGKCKVQTGVPTSMSATLTNIGESTGTFRVYLECPNSIKLLANTFYTLEKQKSTAVYVPITGESAKQITSACVLKAEDSSYPTADRTAQLSVDCIIIPITICTPGTVICDGRDIKTCNEGGSGYNTTRPCKNKCDFNSTSLAYYCVGEEGGGHTCDKGLVWNEATQKCEAEGFPTWLLLIIIIVIVIVLIVLYNVLKERR